MEIERTHFSITLFAPISFFFVFFSFSATKQRANRIIAFSSFVCCIKSALQISRDHSRYSVILIGIVRKGSRSAKLAKKRERRADHCGEMRLLVLSLAVSIPLPNSQAVKCLTGSITQINGSIIDLPTDRLWVREILMLIIKYFSGRNAKGNIAYYTRPPWNKALAWLIMLMSYRVPFDRCVLELVKPGQPGDRWPVSKMQYLIRSGCQARTVASIARVKRRAGDRDAGHPQPVSERQPDFRKRAGRGKAARKNLTSSRDSPFYLV